MPVEPVHMEGGAPGQAWEGGHNGCWGGGVGMVRRVLMVGGRGVHGGSGVHGGYCSCR